MTRDEVIQARALIRAERELVSVLTDLERVKPKKSRECRGVSVSPSDWNEGDEDTIESSAGSAEVPIEIALPGIELMLRDVRAALVAMGVRDLTS